MSLPIDTVQAYFRQLQSHIVDTLEQLDGTPFESDQWDRPEGGGGLSRHGGHSDDGRQWS